MTSHGRRGPYRIDGAAAFEAAALLFDLVTWPAGTIRDERLDALATAGPKDWLELDRGLRSYSAYRWSDDGGWAAVAARAEGGRDPLAIMLLACSCNGRQRERAATAPVMRTDRRLLPLLVLLTTDAVRQVREPARAALDEVLSAMRMTGDVSGLLPAVRMGSAVRDRVRGDTAFAALTELLRRTGGDVQAEARAAADRDLRRLAYEIWCADERVALDDLVEAALGQDDIVCRRRCTAALAARADADAGADARVGEGEPRAEAVAVLERLLTSRYADVRVGALTGLVTAGRPEHGAAFLADRSALMRATAQWALRRSGADPVEHYRAALYAGPDAAQARGLIAGLGECGDRSDVERVAAFLDHDRPRVRAEAVRVIRALSGWRRNPDIEATIAGMATDPAPCVVREVTRAVRSLPDVLPADLALELVRDAARPAHVRLGCLKRLMAADGWIRLEGDLVLVTDPDETLAGRAWTDLVAAVRGSVHYSAPAEWRARLAPLVDAAQDALGAEFTDTLRFKLGLPRAAGGLSR